MLYLDERRTTRKKSSKRGRERPGEIDPCFFRLVCFVADRLVSHRANFRSSSSTPARSNLVVIHLVPILTRRGEAGDARAGSRAGDGGHVDF